MKVLKGLPYGKSIVDLGIHHYDNGRIALELTTNERGYEEAVTRATVNLVEEDCPHEDVWIKDWAENTGMTKWLISMGVIESGPRDSAQTGHVQAFRYKLSQKFLEAVGDALVREGERSRR